VITDLQNFNIETLPYRNFQSCRKKKRSKETRELMEHEEALPRAGGEQPLFVQRVNDSVDSEVDWGIQMFYQDDEGVSDVVHQNGKKNAYYTFSRY